MNGQRIQLKVPLENAGDRLDQTLSKLIPDFSRGRIQQWIKAGRVLVDGMQKRPRDRVMGGEEVIVEAIFEEQIECRPQALDLQIIYQDEALLVIDKPAGLVVHPAVGNPDGTLQNGLLYLDPTLIQLPRAGIVHRLDKETSGLLVVARTPASHHYLVDQLQQRAIHREYRAVAQGVMTAGGSVDAPIGRHPGHRTKMAVVSNGKHAVTHYRVLERYSAHTYLKVKLETGRTHQIRVHMAHIHHPLVGDPVYGGRFKTPKGATPELLRELKGFKRQALHARKLGLTHPDSGEWMEWESPLPADLSNLLKSLRGFAE